MLKIAKFRPENIAVWLIHSTIPDQMNNCAAQTALLIASPRFQGKWHQSAAQSIVLSDGNHRIARASRGPTGTGRNV